MRTNRDFWRGAALAALVLLTVAATVTTKYRGQFAGTFYGLGSGITNASGQYFGTTNGYVGPEITNNCATKQYATWMTNTVDAAALVGRIVPARLPVGLATSNYVGTFSGDGAGLTGLVDTNFDANLYAASTNATVNSSLVINGGSQWGVQFAARGQVGQTNDVVQVQNGADNGRIWGVSMGGYMTWANAPTNAGSATVRLYLVITNNGVGYGIPLHELQ